MHKWTEAVYDQDPATTEDTVYVSEGEHNRSSKGPNSVTTEHDVRERVNMKAASQCGKLAFSEHPRTFRDP